MSAVSKLGIESSSRHPSAHHSRGSARRHGGSGSSSSSSSSSDDDEKSFPPNSTLHSVPSLGSITLSSDNELEPTDTLKGLLQQSWIKGQATHNANGTELIVHPKIIQLRLRIEILRAKAAELLQAKNRAKQAESFDLSCQSLVDFMAGTPDPLIDEANGDPLSFEASDESHLPCQLL